MSVPNIRDVRDRGAAVAAFMLSERCRLKAGGECVKYADVAVDSFLAFLAGHDLAICRWDVDMASYGQQNYRWVPLSTVGEQ